MTAAFLHFFFLSSFCWVLTEAWQSYLAVIGRIRTRLVRKRFLCLGWGKSLAGLGPGWGGGQARRAPPRYAPRLSEGETEAQWRKADPGVLILSMWHPQTSQTTGSRQKGPIPVPVHGGWHRGDAGGGGGTDSNATPLQLQPRLPLSRVASPRGRSLRRLHADQRLRDVELVRGGHRAGQGDCSGLAAGDGNGGRPLSVSP